MKYETNNFFNEDEFEKIVQFSESDNDEEEEETENFLQFCEEI